MIPPRRRSGWQRVIAWTLGVLAVVVLIAVVGVYVLLHSRSFHSYILRTAEQQASESLNTRVEAQNFALHLSNLGLDLYGVTVYGTGPGTNAPLLQVDHIGLGVRILSVVHRQWNLSNVTVDHPVVHLIVDQAGENNLPKPQSSSSSSTNIFDLAVKHIVLGRGEIYYNDRKSNLEADLRELQFQSSYDATSGGRYFGTISYHDGHFQYGDYAPIQHDSTAQFDARRGGMTLSNVVLKSGQSQVLLYASLDNYNNPRIHARYTVMLAPAEFRQALQNPSLPSGLVLLNGTGDYATVEGRPPLESASLEGTIKSSVLQVRTPSLRADVRDIGASYSLSNGNVELRDIRARLLGGEISGSATVRDLTGTQQGHVVAALHNISLADLKRVANSVSLKQVGISGQVNATADATWRGSVNDVVLVANAAANGQVAPAPPNAKPGSVPVNAMIHARYAGASQALTLNQSYIRTPQTAINLNGTISNRSALQVHVQSNDLHELEAVADLFSQPTPGQAAPAPLDLHGTASFDGTVRGSTSAPEIAGQLSANNLQVRGSAFRLLHTNVQASPSLISLQGGELEPAKQGRVSFSLQSGLRHWSYTPSSSFVVNANASQISLAELARLANSNIPVSGTMNAKVALHGTQLNPIGQGDISLHNANISGEPIQAADVRFQGTGETVHANLLVRIAAGSAQGQVTYYPKQQGYDGLLQATNIQLDKIRALRERNMQLTGSLNFMASGRGTVKDPQGQASLNIPQLNIQQQQINNIKLQANVANHEATFSLGSQVLSTPLHAQGKVALTGDYYADASLDTPLIPLQPFLAAYAPAQAANMSGQTEIHATLRGPLKNKALVEAHVNIPNLAVNYRTTAAAGVKAVTVQLAAVTPIRADYANGILSLLPGEIKGTATDVRFQGRLPLTNDAASTLSVQGTIDLGLAEMFDPTVSSSGQLQLDINAAGQRNGGNVEGQIRVVNASYSSEDLPVGLSNGNGILTLRPDRLEITHLTGDVGGGKVTASGAVAYRPAVQMNIALRGNDLRLLYPQSVRSDLDLNLTMTGTLQKAWLQGQVNVNQVSFTPDFDLAQFIAQFSGVSSPPPQPGFADNLNLNVALRSSSELNIVSPAVSIQGDANLRVIGTASDPVIVGRTNLTGGDLIFLGNRYVVEGGTIAFINSLETEPVVNLQAKTTIQQYNISMRFRGPLDRLRTNYTSDPALPPADIIHLLAFGSTEEASNAAPAQSTTLGAESLVASQVTGQVTSRITKVAGISQLSVDPQLGNNGNQQPGARLTVQQRVTGKLFVTFSTDVTTTQNTAVQMQYQVNRKWSFSGVRDQSGGFGLDARYHKEF
jgi:translocation and assembly module TamB